LSITLKVILLLASAVCNCNTNDAVWREDSGTVREAPHDLPIVEVRIADVTPGFEMAKITVGPLVCYEGQCPGYGQQLDPANKAGDGNTL